MSFFRNVHVRRLARWSLLLLFIVFLPLAGAHAQDAAPKLIAPRLNVPIPGLRFADHPAVRQGGQLLIPFLSAYIVSIYHYLIGISLIVATIMIVYGGFLYIMGASIATIKDGKSIIQNTLIGLGILFGSYTILAVVNPDAVNLRILSVEEVVAAKDQAIINELGTGNPDATQQDMQYAFDPRIQGAAPPIKEIDGNVDISGIKIDKSLGAAPNLAKFCAGAGDIKAADSPAKKRDLLARAILGFKTVCVDEHMCAYCQAGGTDLPGGGVHCAGNGRYGAENLIKNNLFTPEGLWGSDQACLNIWDDPKQHNQLLTNKACADVPKVLYSKIMANSIEKAHMAGYDCGGAVFSMYKCAGSNNYRDASFKDKKGKLVGYPDEHAVLPDPSRPDSILFNIPLSQASAKLVEKGGLQFGDLIHICCGKASFASHWFMYTGGRSDVPFSFIEMGGIGSGGKILVPFVNGGGEFSVSSMQIKPKSWTLNSYILNLVRNGWKGSRGRIWVWRPYAD